MRIVLLAALAFISPTAALAKDQFDRPELTVPKDVAKLSILFSDSANWNGKNVPRVMQCERIGGKSPASPALTISGLPDATKSLVVYFANPRAIHNHGLFRISEGREGTSWSIPAIRSRSPVAEFPEGVDLFQSGDTWGFAYSSPCPTSGSWLYTITVYALGESDKVLATGEANMGYAP